MNGKHLMAIGGGLLLGLAGMVNAQATDTNLQAKVDALNARVQELEARDDAKWLNAQRTEEVKALVRDVIADADTRASLQGTGAMAGYADGNFFLSNADGSNLLKFWGLIQPRYIFNVRHQPGATPTDTSHDPTAEGFVIARTQLDFSGHVYSPRIQYEVRLDVDPVNDSVHMQRAKVAYAFMDGKLTVWGGEIEAPFTRETLIADSRQTAVDRSVVDSIFSAGFIQGVGIDWDACEWAKAKFSINDGVHSGESNGTSSPLSFTENIDNAVRTHFGAPLAATSATKDFSGSHNDFGLTARIDLKLAGQWSQWEQENSFSNDDLGVFVGAAVHYQNEGSGDIGQPGLGRADNNQFFAYTVDGSLAYKGWSLYASGNGMSTILDKTIASALSNGLGVKDHINIYGFMVQGAWCWNDKIEPFLRYEGLSLSDLKADGLVSKDFYNIVTAGVNFYQHKHDAKATLDVVWAIDSIGSAGGGVLTTANSNLGLLNDLGGRNQIVVRLQYSLRF